MSRGVDLGQTNVLAAAGLGLGAILAAPAAAHGDDFTVSNLNDDGAGSLRQAIEDANVNAGADRVLFKSKLSGRIELSTTVSLESPMQILGPGARRVTVDATGNVERAFFVDPGAGDEALISGLTVNGGELFNNFGGAIFHHSGRLTVADSTITGGEAPVGGGIFVNYTEGFALLDSTIAGNSAESDGGGIFSNVAAGGELEIHNSTISGNKAGDQGGGAYLVGSTPSSAFIENSTVTGNSAEAGAGGGGLFEAFNGATISGSIIAGNVDGNLVAPDLNNGPWTTSFSLITDTSGATITDQGGNHLDVNLVLGRLKDNGGPTDTHALRGGPAKNKIPRSQTPKNDQRGAPRKGKGDIGAYELVKCEGVVVNRVGTANRDKLKGTKKKDGILGLGGNDVLKGKKGKDGLCGGRGKDKLKGGPGKDKLYGGPGKDEEVQ